MYLSTLLFPLFSVTFCSHNQGYSSQHPFLKQPPPNFIYFGGGYFIQLWWANCCSSADINSTTVNVTSLLYAPDSSINCGDMFRPLISAIFKSFRYTQFDGASQQILRIFFLHKIVVYRVRKIPPLVPVLSQINPIQTFPVDFPEIHFNNILRLRGRFFCRIKT